MEMYTVKTLPITTVSTSSGLTLAAVNAALLATVCNSTEAVLVNLPPYVPNGVRLAPTITTPKNVPINFK